jgi:hypothetical protein
MNNLVRSIMMVTMVVLAFVGGVFVTLRAAEPTPRAPETAQGAVRAGDAPKSTTPAAGAKSAPNAKPPAAAASAAPIEDEPTVAPDSQESADNSVTFPADI